MQQLIVPMWLVVALLASGCSQMSPLGLGKSDAAQSWEASRLDFVVDREEAKRSLRAENRAERERRFRDEFARQDEASERKSPPEKIIHMVSKPRQMRPQQPNRGGATPDLNRQDHFNNTFNPDIDPSPSASLVSHPLNPREQGLQLTPQTNHQSDVADVVIQQLPPMVPAPLERQSNPSMLVPKTDAATSPTRTNQRSFDSVQLVAWEQEVQEEESSTKDDNSKGAASSQPERDEFTDQDFYAAGWCQNQECEDECKCPPVQKIPSKVNPELPAVLPAQFQVVDGPRWELPGLDVGLKPLRNQAGTPAMPLPGLQSQPATQLPIPNQKTNGTQEEPRVRTASASLDGRNVDSVTNADFRAKDAVPLTWRQHLNNAMETIQNQIRSTHDLTEQRQLQGKLDLLRLMPSHLDEQQQQYMDALTELLQSTTGTQPVDIYEAGQTLNQLRDAISYLEAIAGMKVVNANFCSKVKGFGQFDVMEQRIFEPGQTVLIYCEIENHTSQTKVIDGKQMTSTRLAGSCVVYDENQKVVQQEEFPVVEDLATQRRRDFYMHIPFVVGDLPPGKYQYQLMIDDVGGGKSASLEPALEFEVR